MNNPKYFKPEINTPYTIALKYPTPRQVNGFTGPELRWILLDGRPFYTPLDFQAKLESLGIKPGQRFTVEKRTQGRKADWIVSQLPDSRASNGAPQKAATMLEAAGSLDTPEGMGEENHPPARKGPQTALEAALKTAVSAAAEAEKHGQAIGYNVRFASTDIKSMAISVLIGMQQNGRAA
jgi:hypothetical protein